MPQIYRLELGARIGPFTWKEWEDYRDRLEHWLHWQRTYIKHPKNYGISNFEVRARKGTLEKDKMWWRRP